MSVLIVNFTVSTFFYCLGEKMARDNYGSKIVPKSKGNISITVNSQLAILEQNLLSTQITAYPNTDEGLELFKAKSLEYVEYIKQVNASEGVERELIPDIEGWSAYLGTNRTTINRYARRSEKWKQTIENFKNGIASIKKQMALYGTIPPVMAIFDLTNNHGYVNSSEFKVSQQNDNIQEHRLTDKELQEKYGDEMQGFTDIEVPIIPIGEEK